jgi:hypothetical protein
LLNLNYNSMKNLVLTVFALLLGCLLAAQQVSRDKVVIEEATGTW